MADVLKEYEAARYFVLGDDQIRRSDADLLKRVRCISDFEDLGYAQRREGVAHLQPGCGVVVDDENGELGAGCQYRFERYVTPPAPDHFRVCGGSAAGLIGRVAS